MTRTDAPHCSFCAAPLSAVRLMFKGLGAIAALVCDDCVTGFGEVVAVDREAPGLTGAVVAAVNRELADRKRGGKG